MTSLYELGFRQGMLLDLEFPFSVAVWDGSQLTWSESRGESWVIVTQDCDLDQTPANSLDPVELRLAEMTGHNAPSGIRSRFFRLNEDLRLDGRGVRPMVPAAFLATQSVGTALHEDRLLALKLWLGRRYDRPAVPTTLVPLMQTLANKLKATKARRDALGRVRDVFVDVDETAQPPRYALTAVCDEPPPPDVAETLVAASLEVPASLGTPVDAIAVTTAQASIELLEKTYVADLSDASITSTGVRGAHPI